jgi:hypothetical protein
MPRTEIGVYHALWVKGRSTAVALLAALLVEAALVVLLLHVPLRATLVDHHSPTPKNTAPRQVVAYVRLSPPNDVSAATVRITKPTYSPSGRDKVSRSAPRVVVDQGTARIDIPTGFNKSPKAVFPIKLENFSQPQVERPLTEAIDSIIKTIIRPGNDSAAQVRLAQRNAVDWTVAIKGERFGMSPGQLHLGTISIRFPLVFAEPLSFSSDRRRESRRTIEDTRSQAARAQRAAAFDSAVASIRLRRLARERLSKRN